eukprot:TRINITY_DN7570_c0_g2_i1.p1 TRINITY_DN7570_c0_g2~~TRINITY_DN7570_c0_g2_i1.p1  ORF type:complete len:730 (+),score=207.93 TRINITY_DN7570_c0_g2_i1:69-2258(+)
MAAKGEVAEDGQSKKKRRVGGAEDSEYYAPGWDDDTYLQKLDAWLKERTDGKWPNKAARGCPDQREKCLGYWLCRKQQEHAKEKLHEDVKKRLSELSGGAALLEQWEYTKRTLIPIPASLPSASAFVGDALTQAEKEVDEVLAAAARVSKQAKVAKRGLADAPSRALVNALQKAAEDLKAAQQLVESLATKARAAEAATSSAVGKEQQLDTWMAEVLRAFERVKFCIQDRRNITPDGRGGGMKPQGLLFGLVANREGTVGLGHHTPKTPPATGTLKKQSLAEARYALACLLCDLAKRLQPDHTFTSIQVVRNYASSLHVDAGNLGPSLIVATGDYEGGKLWTPTQGLQCIRHRQLVFDGNEPHAVSKWTGTSRYSIIWFTLSRYEEAAKDDLQKMRAMGFHLPAPGLKSKEYAPKTQRLQEAMPLLPKECVHGDAAPDPDAAEESGDEGEADEDGGLGDEDEEMDDELRQVLERSKQEVGGAVPCDEMDADFIRAMTQSIRQEASRLEARIEDERRSALRETRQLAEQHADRLCEAGSASEAVAECPQLPPPLQVAEAGQTDDSVAAAALPQTAESPGSVGLGQASQSEAPLHPAATDQPEPAQPAQPAQAAQQVQPAQQEDAPASESEAQGQQSDQLQCDIERSVEELCVVVFPGCPRDVAARVLRAAGGDVNAAAIQLLARRQALEEQAGRLPGSSSSCRQEEQAGQAGQKAADSGAADDDVVILID